MSRPPSPETVAKREAEAKSKDHGIRLSACQVYVDFLKTNPGMPREPMTLEAFVLNADKVRVYLEGV